MKSKIQLPRGYLSWSQINLWRRSKKQYIDRYFYGEKGFVNDAMLYGKKLADAMETGETDDELIKLAIVALPKYKISEYKLEAVQKTAHGDIPLIGYMDTAEDPPSEGFREYKTGKVPWTQRRADRHGQLTLYAYMIYLKEKKLPKKIHLDWVETEKVGGEISLTGNIQSFETRRTMGELIEMATIVKRTASEISSAYQKELSKLTKK